MPYQKTCVSSPSLSLSTSSSEIEAAAVLLSTMVKRFAPKMTRFYCSTLRSRPKILKLLASLTRRTLKNLRTTRKSNQKITSKTCRSSQSLPMTTIRNSTQTSWLETSFLPTPAQTTIPSSTRKKCWVLGRHGLPPYSTASSPALNSQAASSVCATSDDPSAEWTTRKRWKCSRRRSCPMRWLPLPRSNPQSPPSWFDTCIHYNWNN